MLISVCICTHNRAGSLGETLSCLSRATVPSGAKWEVIVVNNGSSDATEEVLADFASRMPLRIVRESKLGLSHARNAAVRVSEGDIVVWTDDDVLVSPGWLEAYHNTSLAYPDHAIFGGPIVPHFREQPPRWLREGIQSVPGAFALRDLGANPLEIQVGQEPYGANFAVRGPLQRELVFDSNLGRVGSDGGLLGEETTLVRQLLETGVRGRWVPEALVHHVIPPERQTLAYLRGYYRMAAVSGTSTDEISVPRILGFPRWMLRSYVEHSLAYLVTRATLPSSVWLRHFARKEALRGALSARRHWPSRHLPSTGS